MRVTVQRNRRGTQPSSDDGRLKIAIGLVKRRIEVTRLNFVGQGLKSLHLHTGFACLVSHDLLELSGIGSGFDNVFARVAQARNRNTENSNDQADDC